MKHFLLLLCSLLLFNYRNDDFIDNEHSHKNSSKTKVAKFDKLLRDDSRFNKGVHKFSRFINHKSSLSDKTLSEHQITLLDSTVLL